MSYLDFETEKSSTAENLAFSLKETVNYPCTAEMRRLPYSRVPDREESASTLSKFCNIRKTVPQSLTSGYFFE